MTSDEFLSISELPKSAAIIGGGVIGCEFASLLADLGTKVTILEALPKILPGLDKDVTKVIERSLQGAGHRHPHRRQGRGPLTHRVEHHRAGSGRGPVDVDVVVVSIGRRPVTDDLGLDGTGGQGRRPRVHRGRRRLPHHVEPGVWAVGDAIATPRSRTSASSRASSRYRSILGEDPPAVDYDQVPWASTADRRSPSPGSPRRRPRRPGLRRRRAEEPLQPQRPGADRGQGRGHGEGHRREGRRRGAGRILGVHMVGPWVTEQLGQGYLAVNWEATVDEVAPSSSPTRR